MGIKKLLALSTLVFFVIFLSQMCFAASEVNVDVNVEIADAPPRIRSVEAKPDLAYIDSEIICETDIYDENITLMKLEYEWHVNNNLAESRGILLETGLQVGDEVECKVIAIDIFGHSSEKTSKSIAIQPRGFMQATGYAVRNINSQAKDRLATAGAIMLVAAMVFLGFSVKRHNKS